MSLMDLVTRRYSVRQFADRPVEQEKMKAILTMGNLAPTARNLQPQRIYVLQSEEALVKLDSLTHCRYGAGTVLLYTYNTEEEWKNSLEEGVHSGVEDVSIVATHVMLAATELGLDTCWCNYFSNSDLEAAFGLPKEEKSVLIMPVGYAGDAAKPAPWHGQKKDLAETVRYL